MNLAFPDELRMLGAQAQRLFADRNARAAARRALDGEIDYDRELWREMGALGWLAIAIPEAYGGLDLGPKAVCVLAEQLGRSLAAVPFSTVVYLALPAILHGGSEGQKRALLPRIADGSLVVGFADGGARATVRDGRLSGRNLFTSEGTIADLAVIAARDEAGDACFCLLDMAAPGVVRREAARIDLSRDYALINAENVPVEPLGNAAVVAQVLDRAPILFAFEQLGGAVASMELARDYALTRHAFGRPIGSFQAIKHKLARMFVANEIARSNAYFGAWALSSGSEDILEAAMVARISAIRAYDYAAREGVEIFGALGFTWEADCHLYVRRAKQLALMMGGELRCGDRLIAQLMARHR